MVDGLSGAALKTPADGAPSIVDPCKHAGTHTCRVSFIYLLLFFYIFIYIMLMYSGLALLWRFSALLLRLTPDPSGCLCERRLNLIMAEAALNDVDVSSGSRSDETAAPCTCSDVCVCVCGGKVNTLGSFQVLLDEVPLLHGAPCVGGCGDPVYPLRLIFHGVTQRPRF